MPVIETVISKIARIPLRSVGENEKDKLRELETRLKQRVFGQDDAIAAVVNLLNVQERASVRKVNRLRTFSLLVPPASERQSLHGSWRKSLAYQCFVLT